MLPQKLRDRRAVYFPHLVEIGHRGWWKPTPAGSWLGAFILRGAVLAGLCLTGVVLTAAEHEAPTWETRRLLTDFYAEGAAIGDVDGDGRNDLAYGPFWFKGPELTQQSRFAAGGNFRQTSYADNFFSFIRDLTGDGKNDILVFGFPGKEVRLFVNPGAAGPEALWAVHVIADQLCHEATSLVDLIPGGLPEIVGARDTVYGYYEAGADPLQPWTWRPISAAGRAEKPFGHGLGVGDINGDGRMDVIEKALWFEQPAKPGAPWVEHRWAVLRYGTGGAQILVEDVDGDGDSDLISSLNAHGAGIAWFEQADPGKFRRHDIIGESSTDSAFGVSFREPHGLALADIDGDGLSDFVSGKRWFAHNGRDAGAFQEPVVYWFRKTKSAGGIEFVPHRVDNQGGIGVGVPLGDLNGDGRADIVSANKLGLAVHFQAPPAQGAVPERWRVPGGGSPEQYGNGLTPEQAVKQFAVPPGFTVDLIAAEPDLTQPIAMCFDARGRLWMAEGNTYPARAPDGQGKDRVIILEDTDGDGRFDSRKVFTDKLNLVSGIQVGFGGLYVGAAPYLLFIADKNGDDVPDAAPEVLLDGWGFRDTHETLNSLTWGPDGWLYGCHGVFTESNVGKPGAPEKERRRLNAGVWRYHPVRRDFEIFAEGASNPWGLDFDAHGEAFITACVIPHLYHVSQGGRYTRQSGQHFHPYVFDDIDTIADHRHFVGRVSENAFHGPNRDQPPVVSADTSALGGGHAHSGLALYQADEFPPVCRGDLFFSNLHGHRIVRERVERDGSGFIARHMPDFAFARDTQFIGVSVIQGPDGALYVSDWHDKQTCHHRDVEIWDRGNGRIYRVRYGQERDPRLSLTEWTDAALVGALAHRNVVHARLAQRLLQERAAFGKADREALRSLLAEFEREHAAEVQPRLRALWTAHACGLLATEHLIARLQDPDAHVRGWALRFLGEENTALTPAALAAVESLAAKEDSMITRRYAASLLQRLPLDQRWKIGAALIRNVNDQNDRNLPLLAWYGIEPLVEADPARALQMSDGTAWPVLREFVARRAALSSTGREALMASLGGARDAASFTQRARQLALALEQVPAMRRPRGWDQARATGEKLQEGNPALADALRRLGARFGDTDFFPFWRAVSRDQKASAADRLAAIDLLAAGGDPELGTLALELLDQGPLLPALIKALRSFPGIPTAQSLVSRIAEFPPALRDEAINLLSSRPDMALVLLQSVDQKTLPPSLISPVLLDQFARIKDPAVTAIIDRHWTRGGAGVDLDQLAGAIKSWTGKLSPTVLERADAARGRRVFQTTCGICHQLFGEGVALGPDLTGSNRANITYLLENVLAPSAVVGRDYLLHVITQKDGSVISGTVGGETPEFVTVVMPGGARTDIPKSNITARKETPVSLMPAGLFDALPLAQVADLVKYLASPTQVQLADAPASAMPASAPSAPAVATASPPRLAAAPAGVTRIEAESLRPKHATITGGELRRQDMAGFRNDTWSGDAQLFWVSVELGHTLTLSLPDLAPGVYDVTLFPTLARDYGRFRIAMASQNQEADLYSSSFVKLASPVAFANVPVSTSEPLKIVIEPTGANPAAKIGKFGFVFGLDRIEVSRRSAAAGPSAAPSAAAPPSSAPVGGALSARELEDAISIGVGGPEPREVVRFQMRQPPGSGVIVPSGAYFHPLRTPSGLEVTALAPKAHPYYRGLFMGYVQTHGVKDANFWGGGGGPIKGSAIVNADAVVLPNEKGVPAGFRATNLWKGQEVLLVNEDLRAEARISKTATVLDLTYTLTAPADFRLGHCNVGGIALPVRTDGKLTAHGPGGVVKFPSAVYRKDPTNWPASPWYGYTVELPDGSLVSAAIIDHAANPPTRWHCSLGARVINPCITTEGEYVLKANSPLTLRYRVVAVDGPFDTARMAELAREFSGE